MGVDFGAVSAGEGEGSVAICDDALVNCPVDRVRGRVEIGVLFSDLRPAEVLDGAELVGSSVFRDN